MVQYTSGAHGINERRSTVARLTTLAGGRVWKGSVDDDDDLPREWITGRVRPHIVVRFGAPVRSSKERNLTNGDLQQPHILSGTVYCVAGNVDDAEELMAAVVETLVDWAPSPSSDPWEASNGFGAKRSQTANTPTRYIEAVFITTTVNLGVEASTI